MKKVVLLILTVILGWNASLFAQVTTSSIGGRVTDGKEAIPGALIFAKHGPSGTSYYAVSNEKGRFTIQGMRTGGPYTIEVSLLGYKNFTQNNVYLSLGETFNIDAVLNPDSKMLNEVVVSTNKSSQFDANKTGAAMNFNSQTITALPSMSKSIYDITRLVPQSIVTGSGMSFSGTNNRYNSFQVDGSVSNDVFGLSSSGMNGGQAGTNPISLEAIDQVQVVIAPFDVRQSGFTGGGINAITKSGTNQFHGSLYGTYSNQDLIGKTAGKGVTRLKYGNEDNQLWGATLGGPIIKDKLFFFGNFEKVNDSYPMAYGVNNGSNISQSTADQIVAKIKQLTGNKYDGGGYGAMNIPTTSIKALGRIDWNINNQNKFILRYNYVKGSTLSFSNSPGALRLNNNGYYFNSITQSIVAELNSNISHSLYNEFRVGYTGVRDHRQVMGQPFPFVKVTLDTQTSVSFGTEEYSAANMLNQDVWSLSDNLSWYLGNHTLTFGTDNQLYNMKNLFIRDNFGAYTYGSLADFLSIGTANEANPSSYNYSFSRQDITGSSSWAPQWSAAQVGVYAQDEWNINDRLDLTYGLRVDFPIFPDKPSENTAFNSSAIALQNNLKTNTMPKSTPLFSPRVGFRWYTNEDKNTLLRGGVGIFTGRIPFVWLSNAFSNTGVEYARTQLQTPADFTTAKGNGFKFQADPAQQYYDKNNVIPPSEIDVTTKNFKFPQTLRFDLAVEQNLPYGIKGTLEGIFSQTLNNILYKDLAYAPTGKYLNNGNDKRPMYSKVSPTYNDIILLDNTSKGFTYSITGKLEKTFDFGLSTSLAYTYGRSKSVNDGSSSQAISNWQYNYAVDPNNPELGYSSFDIPSHILGTILYTSKFGTTIGLIYNGQSGTPYSYTYYSKGVSTADINGDGHVGNDIMYVPTDAELQNMQFKDVTSNTGAVTYSAAQQRADFGAWINSTKGVKNRKGKYLERNSFRSAFENHFDLHLAQAFYLDVSGRRTKMEVSLDFLNVGNLLNPNWGLYYAPGYNYSPLSVTSIDANNTPTFQYTKLKTYTQGNNNIYNISDFNSRWRAQVGLKYVF